MDMNEETVNSAVARTQEAIKRRAEQAKIAETEKQQRAQDEAVIRKEQTRMHFFRGSTGVCRTLFMSLNVTFLLPRSRLPSGRRALRAKR